MAVCRGKEGLAIDVLMQPVVSEERWLGATASLSVAFMLEVELKHMPNGADANQLSRTPWRRHALLGFAVGLTGLGVLLGMSADTASETLFQGVCLKTGIVTFMWWLALPQLQKLNPFAVGAFGVLAVLAIVRPQLLLLLPKAAIALAPVLCLLWLFLKLQRKP